MKFIKPNLQTFFRQNLIISIASILLFVGFLFGAKAVFPYVARSIVKFRSPPAKRAFYYWKTNWSASPEILAQLKETGISQLYMRFFDVEWDGVGEQTRPVSPIEIGSSLPNGIEIIPVVYITNEVFLKTPYQDVEALSEKIWRKVSQMAALKNIVPTQLQIDCDWTDSSRTRYFHFIDLLAQKLKKEKVVLSTTIRLHQIKYYDRTGIPPANRGMLMFYNFGKIEAAGARSSIFNEMDAKRYTPYIASYPFPLDIVLPIFSWVVHSRDGKVISLLDKITAEELEKFDGFAKTAPLRYTAQRSFFYHGRYFMKDDLLLVEETSPEVTQQAADLAIKGAGWKKNFKTIAFFDLDERNLKHYENSKIQKIFNQF